MIKFSDVSSNHEVKTYIEFGNSNLGCMGYTEHSFVHASKVASTAEKILARLGYTERECELAKIAGYIHDMGNAINRVNHALTGAQIAFDILNRMGMDAREVAVIIGAIGNHDEGTGTAVSSVSAALILADKTDVRRSRVRNNDMALFDVHDRVNYAVTGADLKFDEGVILLDLVIDTSMCSILEYFEIFLTRMLMCRRAADFLKLEFKLSINGTLIM